MDGKKSNTYDVAVIGAGPAGAVCALSLARAGFRVALLEKERLPRDKTCGDALIPDSIAVLKDLGLWEKVEPLAHGVKGIRLHSPAGHTADVLHPLYTFERRDFDALLVQSAREAGVAVFEAVEAVGIGDKGKKKLVTCHGAAPIACRLVVVASGASAKSLGMLGIGHEKEASAIAFRQYFDFAEDLEEDMLRILFDRAILPGYAWMFPVGPKRLNVGAGLFVRRGRVGVNLRERYDSLLESHAEVREILSRSISHSKLTGAPIRAGLRGSDPVGEGVLVTGEALGSTYALTGEGIGKAMATGQLAAEVGAKCLEVGTLDKQSLHMHYVGELERRFRARFQHYDAGQRWVRFPWLVDWVTRRSAHDERFQRILLDILTERRPPTDIFSFWGMARRLVLAMFKEKA